MDGMEGVFINGVTAMLCIFRNGVSARLVAFRKVINSTFGVFNSGVNVTFSFCSGLFSTFGECTELSFNKLPIDKVVNFFGLIQGGGVLHWYS